MCPLCHCVRPVRPSYNSECRWFWIDCKILGSPELFCVPNSGRPHPHCTLRPSVGQLVRPLMTCRMWLSEQEQQRVAVGPGNAHFISIFFSIHQVSSDAVTLRRVTLYNYGPPLLLRCPCCSSAADAAVYRHFAD